MLMELSALELDAEAGELLPAREALGVVKFNGVSIGASNTSLALNYASIGSWAGSTAVQSVSVYQH
jgi:hypothetical protein